jgi:prolyl 4-hydroxylase
MNIRNLDASWKAWLKENIERKCSPDELFGILLKNNFAPASIKEAMGDYFPAHSSLANMFGENSAGIDYEALSRVRLTQMQDANLKRFPSDEVQLYTLDHFLSGDECDAIVDIIKQSLRMSTITVESPTEKYYRTSSTSDLGLIKHEAVEALDKKISRAIGIRPSYSEGIQGQHYEVGQEFKQHTDFFEPGTDEYAEHAATWGNRTWTFMVYLNEVEEGGGTHFVKLKHVFQPRKGQAVIWNNLHPDGAPNYDTLHAGMPVIRGNKTIITKWFREKGAGQRFFRD